MSQSVEAVVRAKWQDVYNQLSGQRGVSGLISFVQVGYCCTPDPSYAAFKAWDIAVNVLRPRPLDEPLSTIAPGEHTCFAFCSHNNCALKDQAAAAFELIHGAKMTQSLIDKFVSKSSSTPLHKLLILTHR